MLVLEKYCGDVTIWTNPPSPYVTISHHFRVSPPPTPVTSFLNYPLAIFQWFYFHFKQFPSISHL